MLLHLLQLEWKKAKKYTVFRVMLVLYILLLPGMLLMAQNFDIPEQFLNSNWFFAYPSVWDYLGYVGNWLTFFFLGFIAVLTVTSEFANKTLRQNIITGMTRTDFYMGKLVFIVCICLFATLYYALVCVISGLIATDGVTFAKMTENTTMIPRYFLMCFGYMAFGFFLGILIRRTGIALFLYLCYVMFIELILRYTVHSQIALNKSMHFYPMNAVEDLAPANFPFSDMAENASKAKGVSIFLEPWEAALTTCIYTSIFLFIAYRIIKTKDL